MNPETVRDFGYHSEFSVPPRRLSETALKAFARELEDRGVSHNRSAYQNNHAELVQSDGESNEMTKIVLKHDRFSISHENVQREGFVIFGQKVEIVAKTVLETLSAPVLTSQMHVIRKLLNPKGGTDARLYLLDRVCRIGEQKRTVFERALHGAGLRFYFPAVDRQDPQEFDVKIESFLRDPSLLYVENMGKFHLPLVVQNFPNLAVNMNRTNDFLLGQVFSFFAQFDESPGEV